MLKMVAALGLGIPALAAGTVAATGVVVVDVRPADGPRIVLPVPLVVAEAAAALVPSSEAMADIDAEVDEGMAEARQWLPMSAKMVEALAEAPDGELVRVEDGKDLVRIAKEGDLLKVEVDGDGDHVRVNVPLSAVQDLLERAGRGTVTASDAVGVLRAARLTQLVSVDSRDGDSVSIRVF